jgi:phospholipid/cholesterol/gamma-HCH transport system substrate-binding protein
MTTFSRFSDLEPRRRFAVGAVALVVVIAVVAAAVTLWPSSQPKRLTAYFTSANGLYTGDRVTILGVPVGQVTAVTPQSGRVKVEMTYDSDVQVPAGAKAAIVTPTLVTTRTVQLTPAYTSGPALADGGSIAVSHTAVPVEWTQIEQEMNTLATALGPKGQSSGALNRLLNTSAANLKGQGTNLHNTLTQLSAATTTLADNKDNLFGTIDNLQTFVQVLAEANSQVNQFNGELSSVSGVLASNRTQLGAALSALNSSLPIVESFVKNNRDSLSSNLSGLTSATANLSKSDQTLADVLQRLPNAASNFNNMYDPINHAITGQLAINNLQDPADFVCETIYAGGGTPDQCQTALEPLLGVLAQSSLPVSVDPLNRNGYSNQTSTSGSSPAGTSSGSGNPLTNLLLGGNS